MTRRFAKSLSGIALVGLAALTGCADLGDGAGLGSTDDEVAADRVLIHFDPAHHSINYGYDIKQDGRASALDNALAQEIFAGDGFDMIRIPVFARRAHPSAGRVTAGEYTSIVNAVRRAQAASPGVKVFASLRLESAGPSFPAWVTDGGHVQADPYAHLLMDFLQYMDSQGVHVDYLGPDNESSNNDGDLTPARFADVVHGLAQRCHADAHVALPQIVGDDEYSPAFATTWLDGLRGAGELSLLDVAGVHYYSKRRTPEYRATLGHWVAAAGSRPLWDTEFHWNDETSSGDFEDAKLGLMTAFDNTDAGIENITWWAYNPASNGGMAAALQSALVAATVHAHPLTTADPDGAALDAHKFNSRAFSQGNDVTLVVVNDTGHDETNRRVELEGHAFDHAVTFRRWTQGGAGAGTPGSVAHYPSARVFAMDFPAQSITFVRLPNVH